MRHQDSKRLRYLSYAPPSVQIWHNTVFKVGQVAGPKLTRVRHCQNMAGRKRPNNWRSEAKNPRMRVRSLQSPVSLSLISFYTTDLFVHALSCCVRDFSRHSLISYFVSKCATYKHKSRICISLFKQDLGNIFNFPIPFYLLLKTLSLAENKFMTKKTT